MIGPAGDDPNGRERVDRLTALIVGGPFDLGDALRFGPGWGQFDHFALDVKHIAGPYRLHPTQTIDTKPQQRVRPSIELRRASDRSRFLPFDCAQGRNDTIEEQKAEKEM